MRGCVRWACVYAEVFWQAGYLQRRISDADDSKVQPEKPLTSLAFLSRLFKMLFVFSSFGLAVCRKVKGGKAKGNACRAVLMLLQIKRYKRCKATAFLLLP